MFVLFFPPSLPKSLLFLQNFTYVCHILWILYQRNNKQIPIFVCPTTACDHPLLIQSPHLSECIGLYQGPHHSNEHWQDKQSAYVVEIL